MIRRLYLGENMKNGEIGSFCEKTRVRDVSGSSVSPSGESVILAENGGKQESGAA